MRRGIAQAAIADIGGLDDEMRRHREIAEQPLAFGDVRMPEAITSPNPHTGMLPKPSGAGNRCQYFI